MVWTAKQLTYLNEATHRWNIKCGATRSGKTYLDYFIIPVRIRHVADRDGLVFMLGNTKGTLQRNVIEPMQKIWGTAFVGDIKSDNTAMLFGEKVHCLGADKINQVDRIRGSSVKYCYGDEIVSWHEEVFEMLKSRLDKPYSLFDGTCNPGSPSHWLKKFIDGDADVFYQQYSIYDNEFLDPTVRAEMEKEHTGVFFTRYILGEWVRAEGLIYPMFSEKPMSQGGHIFTEAPPGNVYVISIDYGTSNPTSAGLWRIVRGVGYRIDEYYHNGRTQGQLTDEEHMQNVISLAKKHGAYPSAEVIIDPSAASLITCFRRNSGFQTLAADNAVIDGIRNTASALQNRRIFIGANCKAAIESLQSYVWDEKSIEEEPLKENDHAADDIRYFVRTYLKRHYHDFV